MSTLRAVTSFAVDGRVVTSGQVVESSDPIVKGREHLFEVVPGVETATAAPGEFRAVKRSPGRRSARKG